VSISQAHEVRARPKAALLPDWTTRPRLGEDCWSRGLQSACFRQVARWRVVHSGASLVDASSIATPPGSRQSVFTRIALAASQEQIGLFGLRRTVLAGLGCAWHCRKGLMCMTRQSSLSCPSAGQRGDRLASAKVPGEDQGANHWPKQNPW